MDIFGLGARKPAAVNPRIINPPARASGRDFSFGIFSFLLMFLVASAGAAAGGLAFGALSPAVLVRGYAALTLVALLYALYPCWNALLYALLFEMAALFAATGLRGEWAMLAYELDVSQLPFIAGVMIAVVVGPSIQVVAQWDKVLVLRLGRFHRVKGPGPIFLAPLIDRCAAVVDTRIRVTDFSAERILTRDTVPIHVDALAFWMIWDAQKAILEVEDFLEAVTLSAQTALRDSVGKYSLSTLLAERDTLYREIQGILDAKTNPWGITILSVEFVDIQLPKDLEDVMSKQAQAEREKKARLLLAEAEEDVAAHFVAAAESYRGNPEALRLRGMAMVYDAIKTRGSMVLLPSGALQDMNIGSVLGTVGLVKGEMERAASDAAGEA
ncbi:MAG: membrane protease subunit, stomatin/prohibitin [Spirochaetae bacterium HGW-Spirochaetae-7]|nr:MAG: membrane protease subunit, stomatin/prohibitin [Spirochaetae bacterium HGW-Spirochaetae-7]